MGTSMSVGPRYPPRPGRPGPPGRLTDQHEDRWSFSATSPRQDEEPGRRTWRGCPRRPPAARPARRRTGPAPRSPRRRPAQPRRHPHVHVGDAVLPGRPGADRQDLLRVAGDGVHHLGHRGRRRVVGRPLLQQADDLGPAVARPLEERAGASARRPARRAASRPRWRGAGSGTIDSPCEPSVIASTTAGETPELLGDEVPEPRRVQDPGHAHDALLAGTPRPRRPGTSSRRAGSMTTIRMASGECSATCSTTARMMPAFLSSRSIRLIPGWRGSPAVITTMSEPAVSA